MSHFKTPLRYPGGKQRLTPFVSEIIDINGITSCHYVEPFAGGAGVALRLLANSNVSHIHLNDSDRGIYAFWNSILSKPDEFCSRLERVPLTIEEWRRQRSVLNSTGRKTLFDLGFSVFFLNRCNRSGILSGGVIGGLAQTGFDKIDARFNREDLINRIREIAKMRSSITISNLDAELYINERMKLLPKNTLVYLDPPYYEKSNRLYLNYYRKADHARLARTIQSKVKQNWILSYDGVTDILELYEKRRQFLYYLSYSADTSYKGQEVFIFSDKLSIPSSSKLKYIEEGLRDLAA